MWHCFDCRHGCGDGGGIYSCWDDGGGSGDGIAIVGCGGFMVGGRVGDCGGGGFGSWFARSSGFAKGHFIGGQQSVVGGSIVR
mmetsp:Transcript_24502/g.50117  ORF Transcript_24502/g.50117 Transcript_24502/m.50117 type:complete len:83 (-) Transcript_24502:201-449(-)